jgi:hypothetical protein
MLSNMETFTKQCLQGSASIMQVSYVICVTNFHKLVAGHSMCVVDKMEFKMYIAFRDMCNADVCIAE